MTNVIPGLTALTLVLGLAPAAQANDYEPTMRDYVQAQVLPWASDPVILNALRAQNAAHSHIQQSEIDALDARWRAEVGTGATPTIDTVLKTPASDFLRARVAQSSGVLSEVFVMDAEGLNVASSGVTSDYWQGDEAKFQQTYPKGAGAVHVGEVEFDESSQSYQAQVSITLADPATGEALGAMTIGINADSLM